MLSYYLVHRLGLFRQEEIERKARRWARLHPLTDVDSPEGDGPLHPPAERWCQEGDLSSVDGGDLVHHAQHRDAHPTSKPMGARNRQLQHAGSREWE